MINFLTLSYTSTRDFFIYLKREKGNPSEQSLPVWAIIGNAPGIALTNTALFSFSIGDLSQLHGQ